MSKKIIAIGGGTIGENSPYGIQPYETEIMDREIIELTNSMNPHILFIGLADPKYSEEYFMLIKAVYNGRYNCKCKNLDLNLLDNKEIVDCYFDWADAIYVGGGNTYTLMKILRTYGIDKKLKESYENGKVMSGISAGGICWFSYGNSVIPTDSSKKLIKLDCLNFKNMVFAPHCDEINGHFENVKNLLFSEDMVGISLSNACALEIVGEKYRLIASDTSRYKIKPFALKSFWYEDKYYIENVEFCSDFLDYEKLISRVPTGNEPSEEVKSLLKRRNIYFNK